MADLKVQLSEQTVNVSVTLGSGANSFTALSDAPGSYTGKATQLVQVNSGETGLEFTTIGERVDDRVNNLLSSSNAITLNYDDANDNLTIGENHSALTNNPHNVTASQVGSPVSVDGVSNAGGDIDLIDGGNVTITADNINNNITLSVPNDLTVMSNYSTTDLSEGTNLYYTDERVDDRVSNLLIGGTNVTLTYDDIGNTLTIDSTDTQLSEEEVQDFAWNVLTGTQTLISVNYDDINNNVDFVVNDDLSLYDNSTSAFITASSTDTLTNKSGNISQWTNDSGYLTNITGELISDLSNVTFTTLSSNDILRYNGTNFVNVDFDTEVSNNTDVSKSKFLQSDKNAGTPNGGVTISEDGAMEFDGVDGYFDTGITEEQLNRDFSLVFWVKKNIDDTDLNIISKDFHHPSMTIDDNNRLYFWYEESSGPTRLTSTENILVSDGWTLASATYNSSNNEMKLYIGKDLVESRFTDGTFDPDTANPYLIGAHKSGPRYYMNGEIYGGIYYKTLSQNEIQQINDAGPYSYSPIGDGLKAQYTGKNFEGTEANPTKIYNMLSSDEVINQDVRDTASPTFNGLTSNGNIRLDGYGTTNGAIESIGTLNLVAGYDNSGNEQITFFPANTASGKFNAAGDLILFNKLDVTGDIQYTSARSSVPAFSNLGTTYTVDFATGTHFSGILNSDVTLTFSNAVSGDKITLILEYDGTAQRTITYPSGIMWAGGSAPTAPASAGKLVVTIMYDGVNYLASGVVFN